jgi:hypothetical protein
VIKSLPIIFPAVAEKVIEKVVEKVKEVMTYITASLTNNILKPAHSYVSKSKLPSPKSIISFSLTRITGLSLVVYSLRLFITNLSFSIITKASRRISTIIASFRISIVGKSCMDVKKYYPSYSLIKNPRRPLGSLLGQFVLTKAQGICMDAKKLYPSYSIVSKPQRPTPTVNRFSTSVGVRKSP